MPEPAVTPRHGTRPKKLWSALKDTLSDEEMLSIDSLKALRDQIAHGRDNNTGYLIVSRYFDAIIDFPEKLAAVLRSI